MSKVLLDTNLLIYSIDEQSKYFYSAQNILLNQNLEIFTTSKNLAEFLSVITRIPEIGLSIQDALNVGNDFRKVLTILYPTERSNSIFIKLLRKYRPTGLSIHDFEIISIGLANSINIFATVNKKDFGLVSEINLFTIKISK